ncbi:MAG: hypothetical protein AAFY41_03540, partial [Bacteroidota bacterium]
SLLCISCKSTGVNQNDQGTPTDESVFTVLLMDNVAPADIEAIEDSAFESAKRISRSENRWMIKMRKDESEVEKTMELLQQDKRVLEVSSGENDKKINNIDSKSGKSKPVKNG